MKKLLSLFAIGAGLGMAAFLSGCGDDDNGNNNNQVVIFAPGTQAGLTAQGATYTVNIAGQNPQTLTFPDQNHYILKDQNGAVIESGTITSATRSADGNTWTVNITPDPIQGQNNIGGSAVITF